MKFKCVGNCRFTLSQMRQVPKTDTDAPKHRSSVSVSVLAKHSSGGVGVGAPLMTTLTGHQQKNILAARNRTKSVVVTTSLNSHSSSSSLSSRAFKAKRKIGDFRSKKYKFRKKPHVRNFIARDFGSFQPKPISCVNNFSSWEISNFLKLQFCRNFSPTLISRQKTSFPLSINSSSSTRNDRTQEWQFSSFFFLLPRHQTSDIFFRSRSRSKMSH